MQRTLFLLAALLWLACPSWGCGGDGVTDDDDTTPAGDDDDDTTAADDDDDDDSGDPGDDDTEPAEEVATPDGGMPVGTPGVQVGLRARADHEGETLTSAPVEVTLVEPTAAAVAAPAPDAGALITAREQMRKAVAP